MVNDSKLTRYNFSSYTILLIPLTDLMCKILLTLNCRSSANIADRKEFFDHSTQLVEIYQKIAFTSK